jgi:hypothetical protein
MSACAPVVLICAACHVRARTGGKQRSPAVTYGQHERPPTCVCRPTPCAKRPSKQPVTGEAVQQQSAATRPTTTGPRPTGMTKRPAQTTVIDPPANSSHRGDRSIFVWLMASYLEAACALRHVQERSDLGDDFRPLCLIFIIREQAVVMHALHLSQPVST